jgi:hypothetical protein
MSLPKIFVGIPQPDYTHHWFQESLYNFIIANFQEYQLQRYHVVGSVIAMNRNRLVRAAQEAQADYLLQIDADSVFPPSALKRLMTSNKDIIGATTTKRDGSTTRPMCEPMVKDIKVTVEDPVIPVKLIGMNFMLTKMEVFDKIEAPWYAEPPREMMFGGKVYDPTLPELVGEDEYFCIKAREAGYDVFCDMLLSMEMGHIGIKSYFIAPNSPPPTTKPLNIITG